MTRSRALILAAFLVAPLTAQQRLIELADPLVGTLNGGNTTPGAQVPFGFISIGPDTASAAFNGMTNGYNPNADMTGFSATHESGTGGDAKYGNFRVTPTVGEASPRNLIYPWSQENASPGFYAVTIGRTHQQIGVELTATRLVAVERYSFPAGVKRNLLLDVSSRILMPAGQDSVSSFPQRATGGQVTVTDARHVEGTIHMAGGWNPAPYTLYFAAELSAPARVTGTWDQNRVYPGRNHAEGVNQTTRTLAGYRNQMGAFFQFAPAPAGSPAIELRLAVSFVSIAKARINLHTEDASSFAQTRHNAEEAWESVLGKIEVQGGTEDQRREFYTALYRSHIMPHDLTGENAWWKSDAPHYEDFYTLWDTFRTLHPLFTLIEPERQTAMVQSLLDTYQHTGWLPDARIAGANGLTQGGSNGDVLLADALVKQLPGVNRTLAYAAVLKDAEVQAPSTPLERANGTDQAWYQGRQLIDWKRLGYMSLTYQRSATRTLEYAADDYSVATVAHLMGQTAVAQQLLKSSDNWRHL
jgi:predicted alpha-1,2-mannosidase